MSMPLPGVPPVYRGVWQRLRYVGEDDDGQCVDDRSTRVVWLQTACWHADLRVPVDTPDFRGVASLAECRRDQLIWLASLTAFVGLTRVEGRFCTWHRLVDLSPGLDKDVGDMRFLDPHRLEERDPRGRYREDWACLTDSVETGDTVRLDAQGLPRWLQRGDHAVWIEPRGAMPETHDLLAPASTLPDDALRWRAGLALHYLHRDDAGWRVALSTRPWRVGERIAPEPMRPPHGKTTPVIVHSGD
ncbi:MAG: hypothetical protein AWU55_2860 [Halomonadaceae bacterium T82-2]|nr:MAG: hypothetical protein AWU55_2860 [Halomonadaceae bacterium T82-2]